MKYVYLSFLLVNKPLRFTLQGWLECLSDSEASKIMIFKVKCLRKFYNFYRIYSSLWSISPKACTTFCAQYILSSFYEDGREHIATRFVNQTNFRRATVLKLKLPECNEVCILLQLINAFDQNQHICETCSRCGHM